MKQASAGWKPVPFACALHDGHQLGPTSMLNACMLLHCTSAQLAQFKWGHSKRTTANCHKTKSVMLECGLRHVYRCDARKMCSAQCCGTCMAFYSQTMPQNASDALMSKPSTGGISCHANSTPDVQAFAAAVICTQSLQRMFCHVWTCTRSVFMFLTR